MIILECRDCDSKDLKYTNDFKYIVCNTCGKRVFTEDLEMEFGTDIVENNNSQFK